MCRARGTLAFTRARRAIVATLIATSPAAGHDFWIQPSTFAPPAGTVVRVHLRLGHAPEGQPVVRDLSRIERFVAVGPRRQHDVAGLDGRDPAGFLRLVDSGVHIIAYQSKAASIELDPTRFTAYLKEEGLEEIIAERARRAETNQPGRERYTRCAKALLAVGTESKGFDRRVQLPLEIVPLQDPLLTKQEHVDFQIVYRHKACAGLLVTAIHEDPRQATLSGLTDAEGKVRLKLERDGIWLIKAVHMTPASSGGPADWESYWASLTFQRGAAAPAAAATRTSPATRPADHERAAATRPVGQATPGPQ